MTQLMVNLEKNLGLNRYRMKKKRSQIAAITIMSRIVEEWPAENQEMFDHNPSI